MSKRINITVPDDMFDDLTLYADKQKRSVASLVTYLASESLERAKQRGDVPKKEDSK